MEAPHHAAEPRPGQNRRVRGREAGKLDHGETVVAEMRHRLLGAGRPDPRQQLQDAETGDGVPRVFRPAQDRQQIFDVRRLDKF